MRRARCHLGRDARRRRMASKPMSGCIPTARRGRRSSQEQFFRTRESTSTSTRRARTSALQRGQPNSAVFVDNCVSCGYGQPSMETTTDSGADLSKGGVVANLPDATGASFVTVNDGWVIGIQQLPDEGTNAEPMFLRIETHHRRRAHLDRSTQRSKPARRFRLDRTFGLLGVPEAVSDAGAPRHAEALVTMSDPDALIADLIPQACPAAGTGARGRADAGVLLRLRRIAVHPYLG